MKRIGEAAHIRVLVGRRRKIAGKEIFFKKTFSTHWRIVLKRGIEERDSTHWRIVLKRGIEERDLEHALRTEWNWKRKAIFTSLREVLR